MFSADDLISGMCVLYVGVVSCLWLIITGNSTDTLELAGDSIEYEVPQPHMMSMNCVLLLAVKYCR